MGGSAEMLGSGAWHLRGNNLRGYQDTLAGLVPWRAGDHLFGCSGLVAGAAPGRHPRPAIFLRPRPPGPAGADPRFAHVLRSGTAPGPGRRVLAPFPGPGTRRPSV